MEGKLENVKKIAILRPNAIGDFIVSLPGIQALKDTYPDAEIVLIGKNIHKLICDGRSTPIDRVEVLPAVKGVGAEMDAEENKEEIDNFIQRMVDENFDLGVQMTGGGKNSNPFLLKMKSKFTIGSKADDAIDLDRTIPYLLLQNEVIRYLEIVGLIGAYTKNISPLLTTASKDFDELEKLNIDIKNKYVVIHPGSNDIRRQWSEENFAEVSKFLKEKGFNVYLVGDKSENDINEKITYLAKHDVINLSGKLSISGLIGLLSKAEIVIANDSGPGHMAYALGTKLISIVWIQNYTNYGQPWRKNYIPLVSFRTNCHTCNARFFSDDNCKHKSAYVSDIKVSDVINSVNKFI